MYIKLYYKEEGKNLKSMRAVDYNNKDVAIDLDSFVGSQFNDNLKREVSNVLKGYFVTNWVRE